MEREKKLKIISPFLLVIGAVIWGVSFVAQSEGGDIGSFTFQGIRCLLACFSIYIVVLVRDNFGKNKENKKKYPSIKAWYYDNKVLVKAGIICGIALTAANNLQQFGIDMQGKETSTGRAAFLTALYIILVPIFGVFLRKKIKPVAWLSVAVALVGLYLISIKPNTGFSISTADFLLILCAVFFSVQIITIDRYSPYIDGVKLSCIQFFIAGVVSTILMFIFEKPDINAILAQSVPLLYSGVMSGGIAFTLQIIGQKRCNPVLASLLMSLESVFSALADWIIRGNTMNTREILGCAVMFAAIILAQSSEFKQLKNLLPKNTVKE